jgi:activator of HSP90 ATPase
MAATHGKDLLANSEGPTPSGSGANTPAPSEAPKASSSAPAAKASKPASKAQAVNTASVSAESSFMISASDLFELLTNENKVPTWTRNPAKIKAEPGSEIALFGGNITGKVLSVEKPSKFVSTWRAPGWPEGAVCSRVAIACLEPLAQDILAL